VAFLFPHVGSAEFVDSLGSEPEAYHRRFTNANGPQYSNCSSQIQPHDTDTCIACSTSSVDIEEREQSFKI
jgi:hypothetical protein